MHRKYDKINLLSLSLGIKNTKKVRTRAGEETRDGTITGMA